MLNTTSYLYPKVRGKTSDASNPNKNIPTKIDAMINASRLNMGGPRRRKAVVYDKPRSVRLYARFVSRFMLFLAEIFSWLDRKLHGFTNPLHL